MNSATSGIDIDISLQHQQENAANFNLEISLSLPLKGVTAVFGESGSGKTTLLRCLAGLENPKNSKISVNNCIWQNDTTFVPPHKRSIGYVFQEASLFSHLNVMDNIQYGIKRSNTSLPSKVFDDVVDMLAIGRLLSKKTDQLSGGEKQRVAIARALLIQPEVLLMDEPLASLDYGRKQEVLPYIENLSHQCDIPIIYVSHDLQEVSRLADYAVILSAGKVSKQGPASSVFSDIELFKTTHQIPSVTINGKVVERDEEFHLMKVGFDGGELWLKDTNTPSKLRLNIKAKDVSVTLEESKSTSILNRLKGTITKISEDEHPATELISVRVGTVDFLAQLSKKSVATLHLKPGLEVWLQVKSAAILR